MTLTVVDSRRKGVAHAFIRLALRRNGRWLAAASVRANARGSATLTRTVKTGCYSVKIARVTSPGFAWNRVTPKNGYCVT